MAHADEIDHSFASPSYQQSRCSFPPAEEACDWWKPNHYLCGDAWGEGPTHLRAKAKEFTMFARLRHRVLGMNRSDMLAVCTRVYIQYYSVYYILHYMTVSIVWLYVYCIYHFTIYTHLQWYLLCINSKCSDQPLRILHFEVEEFEFELNEVYSIDIVMSTGEGIACSRYLKICEVCMKARLTTAHFKSTQIVLRPRQGNRDQKYCLQESCRGPRDSDSRPRNSTQTCTPCHLMSLAHLAEVENMYSLKTQKARQFISEAQMAKSKHFQLDPIGLRFWIFQMWPCSRGAEALPRVALHSARYWGWAGTSSNSCLSPA